MISSEIFKASINLQSDYSETYTGFIKVYDMEPNIVITPHAQRERGKVIGRGVHIYIYIYIYMSVVEKKI